MTCYDSGRIDTQAPFRHFTNASVGYNTDSATVCHRHSDVRACAEYCV